MDSNKVVISYQIKDSFGDRVCDDLCEELFQWLPIKDKINLILVSKQFQRCLHTLWLRQKCLDLNDPEFVCKMNDVSELVKQDNYRHEIDVNVNKLVNIFKMFPNLCKVKVESCLFSRTASRHILSSINKYCHKLNSFSFDFKGIKTDLIKEFSDKFGPKLQTLIIDSFEVKPRLRYLLERTTSLVSLELQNDCYILFKREDNVRRCLLKDLKKLDVGRIGAEDWSKLVDNNLNLIDLQIGINTDSSEESFSVLRNISQLKQLKRLFIEYEDNNSYDNRVADSMALISKNCKKLDYFGFYLGSYKSFDTKHFINGFKHFSTLIEINLKFNDIYDELIEEKSFSFDLNLFKNCKQLTQFSFLSKDISKDFIPQISSVFPNLKGLSLETRFEDSLTDNDLKSLSQLKHLQMLSIGNEYSCDPPPISSVTDSGVLFLINNCNNLRKVRIYFKLCLTDVSIQAMAEKAAKNPDIYYKYSFYSINNINHKLPELELPEHKIPKLKNLRIIFETELQFNDNINTDDEDDADVTDGEVTVEEVTDEESSDDQEFL